MLLRVLRQMRRQCAWILANRLTVLTVVAVMALSICLLLAGFVPTLDRAEVRRVLNLESIQTLTPPVTRPLSHVVNQARGLLTNRAAPSEDAAIIPAMLLPTERAQLAFEGHTVNVRTANGLTPLVPGLTSSALLALMPENLPDDTQEAVPTTAPGDYPDNEGLPLRWNISSQSCDLGPHAQRQLLNRLERRDREQNAFAYNLRQRAIRYRQSVESYARKFLLKPDLVYAIMYTESSFNPDLISGQDAHGLMQVVPGTAGGEVNAWLGRTGLPTTQELLNPAVNIQYGTAYLHLLLTRHLNAIADPLSREYCAIASYNIGSGNMLKVFGRDWSTAFAAINSMTPDEVRSHLIARLPARETRAFFNKVLSIREHFAP